MAIQDPRNFFLNSVEDRLSAADELVARHKKQLQTRYNKRLADKANKAVDTVFYAARDESPEDEAKRKKGEISKMLGREDSAAPKSTPLPEPEPSEEEDILRPKDRAKGTGAYLRKRESFSKLMGLEEEPSNIERTPKAKVVAEDELVQSFFAKAHGSNFDPNSKVDKAKMQKILGMVNAQPELLSLTPGKFAVKLYTAK